jgi:hypothetical protein
MSLYELFFDATPDPWSLGDPQPSIDSWPFRRGERVEPPDDLHVPVKRAGRALDVTIRGVRIIVVTERIGALIDKVAPGDVQRIPVHVEGTDGRYEVLHVLTRMDCVDWEHTCAQAKNEEGRYESGTLASLASLIDRDKNLYRHVMNADMTLKTDGIAGPRIFRVVGWDLWPVVTEDLKVALERERPSGLEFQPLQTSGAAGGGETRRDGGGELRAPRGGHGPPARASS